jgi:hypothetical protein
MANFLNPARMANFFLTLPEWRIFFEKYKGKDSMANWYFQFAILPFAI